MGPEGSEGGGISVRGGWADSGTWDKYRLKEAEKREEGGRYQRKSCRERRQSLEVEYEFLNPVRDKERGQKKMI